MGSSCFWKSISDLVEPPSQPPAIGSNIKQVVSRVPRPSKIRSRQLNNQFCSGHSFDRLTITSTSDSRWFILSPQYGQISSKKSRTHTLVNELPSASNYLLWGQLYFDKISRSFLLDPCCVHEKLIDLYVLADSLYYSHRACPQASALASNKQGSEIRFVDWTPQHWCLDRPLPAVKGRALAQWPKQVGERADTQKTSGSSSCDSHIP